MFKPLVIRRIGLLLSVGIAAACCLVFLRLFPEDTRTIFINEVCTANASAGADADGKYRNYVELYNAGDEEADLTGMYLTDKRKRPKKFSLQGVTIPAHGYAVIWLAGNKAEEDNRSARDEIREEKQAQEETVEPGSYDYPIIDDTGLHVASSREANFDYDIDGGSLYLTSGRTAGADFVRIPKLSYNTSFCRVTDGSPSWHTAACTIGVSNDGAGAKNTISLAEPVFSQDGGFYDAPFNLTLTSESGTQIYYTLDGSDPSPENPAAMLYEVSIPITDPSGEPNHYAVLTNIRVPDNYTPDGTVDKARVVRAAAFNLDSGQQSRIVTRTYFVGYQEKDAYAGLPVISLTSDPVNLFDYYQGIYTTGVTYEEYLKIGGFQNWDTDEVPALFYKDEEGNVYIPDRNTGETAEDQEEGGAVSLASGNRLVGTETFQNGSTDGQRAYWRYQYANATQSGRTWERGATLSYYDENHELQFTQNVGIRIAGESSRSALQKSLNIYARKAYDTAGNGKFTYPLFYEGEIDKFRLRRTDTSGLSRDDFLMELAADRNVGIERGKPVCVFLDGEYWGIYYLREQYRKEYFGHYYQADPDDVSLLKNMEQVMGSGDAAHDYDVLVQQITLMDMSDPVQYGVVERYINLDSLIDWYCLNLYADNEDVGSDRNISVWKTESEEGEGYLNGKWNYLLYDMDVTVAADSEINSRSLQSLSGTNVDLEAAYGSKAAADDGSIPGSRNTFEAYRNRDATFYLPGWLCSNEEFRKQYCTTLMDIANTTYSYHRVHAYLKKLEELAGEQCVQSIERFVTSDQPEKLFIEDYNKINAFFRNRRAYIEQYLREDQNLTGQIVPVTVEVENAEGGSIQVNSATLNETEMEEGWTGDYFSDFPVTVRAEAADGYHFKGWQIQAGGSTRNGKEEEITLELSSDSVILKAVFEKNS